LLLIIQKTSLSQTILNSEIKNFSQSSEGVKDNQLLASYNDGRSKKNTWKHFDY
jgi:hypothetical protein